MLKQALFIIWKNLVFYIVLMVCLVGLLIFSEYAGSATLLLLSILAGNVQNSVFRSENFIAAAKTRMLPLGRHLIRSIGVILVVLLISAPPIVYFHAEYGASKVFFQILAGLTFVSSLTIVLLLVGTWLPAGLYGTNMSLRHAFRRGRSQPFSAVLRIVLGMAVPFVWLFASVWAMFTINRQHLIARSSSHTMVVITSIVFDLLVVIGCTYISVVLARRYMEAEHIEPPPRDRLLAIFA
ncbi:hypothetical protein ACQZ6F_12875 [Rhizobium sp. A22-96]